LVLFAASTTELTFTDAAQRRHKVMNKYNYKLIKIMIAVSINLCRKQDVLFSKLQAYIE
jgi:hypothetical protein